MLVFSSVALLATQLFGGALLSTFNFSFWCILFVGFCSTSFVYLRQGKEQWKEQGAEHGTKCYLETSKKLGSE